MLNIILENFEVISNEHGAGDYTYSIKPKNANAQDWLRVKWIIVDEHMSIDGEESFSITLDNTPTDILVICYSILKSMYYMFHDNNFLVNTPVNVRLEAVDDTVILDKLNDFYASVPLLSLES